MEEFQLVAKTFPGLEEVLANELNALGAKDVTPGRRMVLFKGDKEMMYRANFALRTATHILKPINSFKAKDADEVYDAVKAMNWEDILDLDTSFAVDSVVYSEDFRHSKFVAYKVKDAIVDYFREKTGKRPNISVTNPDIRFNIHIAENDCTLSLDSSGESLHKRGYRKASIESPINEVLAAAMILMTGWKGECDLIDPMCGSGTIAIEAALIAKNMAPGIFREKYAFEKWKDFDKDIFERIYNDDSSEKTFEHKIYAYDVDVRAVNITKENIKAAGVSDIVNVEVQDIRQFKQPAEKAIMVTNPPYGERISSPNLLGLYRTIGERLKHQFMGNDAWIISYQDECFAQIGLKPSLKIPLFNGALDCELRKYQIFDGKLDAFRSEGNDLKTDEERRRNATKRKKVRPRNDEEYDNNPWENDIDIPDYIMKRHKEFMRSPYNRDKVRNSRQYSNQQEDERRSSKQYDEEISSRQYFNQQNNEKRNTYRHSNQRNNYSRDDNWGRGDRQQSRDKRQWSKDKKQGGKNFHSDKRVKKYK